MNFETRQRCGTCPASKQNKTRFTTGANCQRWWTLVVLITFKFSAKITYTPGILTPGDFQPDSTSGQVVLRWKSPDCMADC